ncbi:MAG: hypothetical protein JSS96_17025, partial [Bacteroidetes bacterium]|nr:hypothetical protein [Bacteroidota bacterium]
MKNSRVLICGVIAIALGCVMVMTSCTYKSRSAVNPNVSFSKDLIPIFHNSCAINSGCHEGANNGNDNIDFRDSIAYNTIMNKGLVNTSNP